MNKRTATEQALASLSQALADTSYLNTLSAHDANIAIQGIMDAIKIVKAQIESSRPR